MLANYGKKGGETMQIKSAHLLGVAASFLLALVMLVPGAQAAQVTNLRITLSDPRPNPTTTTHTFAFTHTSGATLKMINFEYCTTASGACTAPANINTSSATKGTLTGVTTGDWTINTAVAANPKLLHTSAGEAIGAGAVMSLGLGAITNHAIDDCQAGGDASSDTCYVRLTTCTETTNCSSSVATNKADEGIASYTVVAAVTVTARVDPTFTFVVNSVAASVANNAITTSVASTFNTLPFGNLTAGTPKYAAHRLNVTTNTQAGYTVSNRMITPLTGVYPANNIDPFPHSWSSPAAWTEPTGTAVSVNTGWIGANTTDADVANWNGDTTQKFGGVTSSAQTVMQSATSDNGVTGVYVTYAIEANVFQPADTYTGVLVYNALPTY